MTIEEKARRFDDAIKVAEKYHNGTLKDVMETIFPELVESEDEKIRKELLQIVKENEDSFYMVITPNKRERLIAWLEKQGMGISEDTKQKLEDNLNKALEKETSESWNEFLDGGEQNLAWSEEDEKMLVDCFNILHRSDYPIDKVSKAVDWLKSLRPWSTWLPSDEQMKALRLLNLISGISYAGQKQELIDLYNDLKKLKGK